MILSFMMSRGNPESIFYKNQIQLLFLLSSFAKEREYDAKYKLDRLHSKPNVTFDFDHYWEIEEVNDYIEMLERNHSDIVSIEVIGNSTQKRTLRIIYVSLAGRGHVNGSRPIVFIDAGVHGRSWISHHAGLYMLRQLIENRADNLDILEAVDFVIIPIVNPDGYRYSRFAVSNRLILLMKYIIKLLVSSVPHVAQNNA